MRAISNVAVLMSQNFEQSNIARGWHDYDQQRKTKELTHNKSKRTVLRCKLTSISGNEPAFLTSKATLHALITETRHATSLKSVLHATSGHVDCAKQNTPTHQASVLTGSTQRDRIRV